MPNKTDKRAKVTSADEEGDIVYQDNPELGNLRVIKDFLPPPEELNLRPDRDQE